jgi:hypothetical protein
MSMEAGIESVSQNTDPDLKLSFISCPHCKSLLTEKEIRSILGQFARSKRFSSLGASRFAKMTPEERSAEGRRAASARWVKREALERSVPE